MTPTPTASAPHVYIVHGFQSSPHDNWFEWLAQQARSAGAVVTIPAMPAPDYPQAAVWQQTLDRIIGQPEAQTILVGHSLGVITLLRFLSRHQPAKLCGLILAAGFASRLPTLHMLDEYIDASQPDFSALQHISMPVHSIISTNDPYVPEAAGRSIAASLHSHIDYVPNGGHLMAEDGFSELTPAWHSLKQMLTQVVTTNQ